MNNESSVPGVSLESMVKMSLIWEPTADPSTERAVFNLPRNAGRLSLVLHHGGDAYELSVDYQDSCHSHGLRNVIREAYKTAPLAKKWAVLRITALIWMIERSHGNTADFHFEAPPGL